MEYIYAALLLHKLGKPIDEGHLNKVIAAAGGHVDEAKVKSLVASLHGVDIAKELENANAVVVAAPSGGEAHAKKEEKKEEKKEAESAAGLSALFD